MLLALSLAAAAVRPLQAQNHTMKHEQHFRQLFPQGEKLPERFARYFIGQAYLAPLTGDSALNVPVSNVTFEPGCRNNWHSHTGGQLLICAAGYGYYQEQGRPARRLSPGNVVEIAPDIVHWHGAAPDSWFAHLAIECNPSTNVNTWLDPVDDAQYAAATARRGAGIDLSPEAARNREAWFAADELPLDAFDPELSALFSNFAFGETMTYGNLDPESRMAVTLAACVALHAVDQYRILLDAALRVGLSPVEIREIVYHAVPYVGMARCLDFIRTTDAHFAACGIELPLPAQSVTTAADRHDKGLSLQKRIFGEQIGRMAEGMPENQRHIARYLSANCFGDYQTRPVFDPRQREMLTFALLVSLGGCEPQVKSHIRGNVCVGNDKRTLLAVVTQLLPYIGYPRTLNAIACLNEAIPENE